MRHIKRYDYNRKLYDYTLKGYINLTDILQAVKDGDEFTIVDGSGNDITDKIVSDAVAKLIQLPREVCNKIVGALYEID